MACMHAHTCSHHAVTDMVHARFHTKSDSFYFADGKLIMHNKAEYAYVNL